MHFANAEQCTLLGLCHSNGTSTNHHFGFHVRAPPLQVVKVTISSAGAAEQEGEHNSHTAHHQLADTIQEEPGSEEETDSMLLYNMLSYAS